jgi:hypothetical protein
MVVCCYPPALLSGFAVNLNLDYVISSLSSQPRGSQFFLQGTQVAILLTQCRNVARPCLALAELLVQDAHLCEVLAGFLVVLTTSLCNQSFGMLSLQLYCLTRSRLFGCPGDLKGCLL